MTRITDRITSLRKIMSKHNVQAYIITGTDPHMSEYLPDYWQERKFISGFTGSAGRVVITASKAALWTDSRYFLQAHDELKGTGIQLMKLGIPETPSINKWLAQELKSGENVGVNPLLISCKEFSNTQTILSDLGLNLIASEDLIAKIWDERPSLPNDKVKVLNEDVSGESTQNKLSRLRSEMKVVGASHYVVSMLDEIAWLLNIRGKDIHYNPVAIAYVIVDQKKATLYIDPAKCTTGLRNSAQIHCADINQMERDLIKIETGASIALDMNKLNYSVYKMLECRGEIKNLPSWVENVKAQKNTTELAGFRRAMVHDGVALCKFFKWLEEALGQNITLSEYSLSPKLKSFRAAQAEFIDESFNSIVGYNENGAIVHYSAPIEGSAQISAKGVLLLDSGGQYKTGTTDITRTISLSPPSEPLRKDYTLVLKGHLALSRAVFPEHTRGSQLDILARQFLWENELDYGHGTGHGVGHYLNVHEGPQSIRKQENPVTLKAGMVISNEPGLYRSGSYGIRIENLVAVSPKGENGFGTFLEFETLTLYPYDLKLIDTNLLYRNEIAQINAYHQRVYDELSVHLSNSEKSWLKEKTSPIPTK